LRIALELGPDAGVLFAVFCQQKLQGCIKKLLGQSSPLLTERTAKRIRDAFAYILKNSNEVCARCKPRLWGKRGSAVGLQWPAAKGRRAYGVRDGCRCCGGCCCVR
jgi:hypothetical protein